MFVCVFTGLWDSAEWSAALTAKPRERSWDPEGESQSVCGWQVKGSWCRVLEVSFNFLEWRAFAMTLPWAFLSASQSGRIDVRLPGPTIAFVAQDEELQAFTWWRNTARRCERRTGSLLCTTWTCKAKKVVSSCHVVRLSQRTIAIVPLRSWPISHLLSTYRGQDRRFLNIIKFIKPHQKDWLIPSCSTSTYLICSLCFSPWTGWCSSVQQFPAAATGRVQAGHHGQIRAEQLWTGDQWQLIPSQVPAVSHPPSHSNTKGEKREKKYLYIFDVTKGSDPPQPGAHHAALHTCI